MSEQEPPQPIYAVFAGPIDGTTVPRIFQGFTQAISLGVPHIHVLFQSYGGAPGDGIALFNFFRALKTNLTLYNCGNVCSAAVLAYLGAQERKVSAYASFMIHRTFASPQGAIAERMEAVARSLRIDDDRSEAVLRTGITLTDKQWDVHKTSDLWFTAQESVDCGLATSIGEFSPPLGSKIFNV